MGLDRLQRAELWGGPFDGERCECATELWVWEEIGTSDFYRGVPPHPEPERVARFLGVYRRTDPQRLTWFPNA